MEKLPISLTELVSGILMFLIIAGLVIYVLRPEKKCPKCQKPLVRFMPPGSNYFQEGCPSCNTYTREK